MDKPDLESKKVVELKQLLKEKKLSTTGTKKELVERLVNYVPPQPKLQESYLDLLPKDILNIVEEYQIHNSINNRITLYLIDQINHIHTTNKFEKAIIEWAKQYNIPIESEFVPAVYKRFGYGQYRESKSKYKIQFGKLPVITNKMLSDLLILFVTMNKVLDIDRLNDILLRFNSKLRIVKQINRYEIGEMNGISNYQI